MSSPKNLTNGEREVCRRLRQEIRSLAKRAIQFDLIDGVNSFNAGTLWDQMISDPETFRKFRTADRTRLLLIRNQIRAELAGAVGF